MQLVRDKETVFSFELLLTSVLLVPYVITDVRLQRTLAMEKLFTRSKAGNYILDKEAPVMFIFIILHSL